jgi:hypothetical protein
MLTVRTPDVDRLLIDTEPKKLTILSEPYLVLNSRGYAPVVDVLEARSKTKKYMYIAAKSISLFLDVMRQDNKDRFIGLEFWIWKESDEKGATFKIRN